MVKYATVHMLIINEKKYIDGACISVHTYRKFGNKDIEHIVMIDDAISKAGVEKLKQFFDKVYVVEPTYVKSDYQITSEGRKERYGGWIDYALTKWNIFRMTDYSKVLLCDIDTLANADYTDIFSLKTPAWCMFHKKILENREMSKIVSKMHTGDKLSKELLEKFSLQKDACSKEYSGFTPINTSLTLVKPSIDLYNGIMDMVQKKIDEYGYYPVINSGTHGITPDDSALFEYFHCLTNKRSYIIGPEYLSTKWLWEKGHIVFKSVKTPIITNYDSTDKPWLKKEETTFDEEKDWIKYKKELGL
jgi:hypothetical protein